MCGRHDHPPGGHIGVVSTVTLVIIMLAVGCGVSGEAKDTSATTEPSSSTSASTSTTTSSTTTSTTTTLPTTVPTTPSTSPPSTAGDFSRQINVGKIHLQVPARWTLRSYGSGTGGCLGPPPNTTDQPCLGLNIATGSALDTASEGGPYRPDADYGWYGGSDVPSCNADGSVIASSSKVVESGLKPVGSKKADYRRWAVVCQDGSTQTVEAWLLPTSRILFTRVFGAPESAQVLAAATIG